MRYRDHRGDLAESVETTREVSSREELVAYLRAKLARWSEFFDESQLQIVKYSDGDPRIGWEKLSIVYLEGFGVLGWLEGML